MENADDLDQMILSSAVSLWSEEDSIPISAIKWCLQVRPVLGLSWPWYWVNSLRAWFLFLFQERVLLIAKGQFLIAFKFDDDFLHCPKSFCRKASKPKIRHRHVGTELPITGQSNWHHISFMSYALGSSSAGITRMGCFSFQGLIFPRRQHGSPLEMARCTRSAVQIFLVCTICFLLDLLCFCVCWGAIHP